MYKKYNCILIFKQDTLIGYNLTYNCEDNFIINDDDNCTIYNYVFGKYEDYSNFVMLVCSSANCCKLEL